MNALKWLWNHKTAISGGLQATNALLAGVSFIRPALAQGIGLTIGIIQVWIGVANTIAQQDEAP